MTTTTSVLARERRVLRRLESRGADGLAEALFELKGVVLGGRYRMDSLYAVGGEGAVFLLTDLHDPTAPVRVAKIALLPVHRPFDLTEDLIERGRLLLRQEAQYLAESASPFMPRSCGVHEFANPLLDAARGGAFAAPEPALVMEQLAGWDLDLWIARIHRSGVSRAQLAPALDNVARVLLRGLADLEERGVLYADLRPGNLRVMGRPQRTIRLLDAGSLVAADDASGRFPHVPGYLPPDVYADLYDGLRVVPNGATLCVMAGRTLYEIVTGRVPLPGEDVRLDALDNCLASDATAALTRALCAGEVTSIRAALDRIDHTGEIFPEGNDVAPRHRGRPTLVAPTRALPTWWEKPVVMLTVSGDIENELRSLEAVALGDSDPAERVPPASDTADTRAQRTQRFAKDASRGARARRRPAAPPAQAATDPDIPWWRKVLHKLTPARRRR